MKLLLVLALLVPATLANVVKIKGNGDPLELQYRKGPNVLKATLSLQCAPKGREDQYEVVVSLDNKLHSLSQAKSYIQLLQNGPKVRPQNNGDLVLTGSLKDLQMNAAEKSCRESGRANCGVSRSGSLEVWLLVEVPNSKSKLHWPALYEVEIECGLAPLDPFGPKPLVFYPLEYNLTHCVQFGYIMRSFFLGPFVWVIDVDFRANSQKFQLDSCNLQTNLGENIPIMANGRILDVPHGQVSGRSVGRETQYELNFTNFGTLKGSASGKLNCRIAYCRAAGDTLNVGVPVCPIGEIPRVAGSIPSVSVNPNIKQTTIETGKLTLAVATAAGSQSKRDCA